MFADGILVASDLSESTYTNAAPYVINFNTSYYGYEKVFQVNESVNDLKAMASWSSISNDLDVRLTSPSGTSYGRAESTSGYFTDERFSADISIRDTEFDTFIDSSSPNTNFGSSTSLYVTSDMNNAGDQAASIMKWSLPSAPTHNTTIQSVTLYLKGVNEPYVGWDAGSDSRSITVYDVLTPYSVPTWNNNATSQTWESGSFSGSDYNNSYAIDTLSRSSSIAGDVVEFNITDSMWGTDRVPEWDDECSIVLVGSGYAGTDADPSIDRFASSDTNENDHHYDLNGWRPLIIVEYSITKETSEFVWVQPTFYEYPDTDMVEAGNWTLQVSSSSSDEPFTLTTFIDKKSATQIASKAFISSFDESRGDLSGLVLYSDNHVVTSDNQSSYIRNKSEWLSYFTPEKDAFYSFELSWNDSSTIDMSLYEGTELLSSSNGIDPKVVNSSLLTGNDYHIIVNKSAGTENDTFFTINATSRQLSGLMSAYYDSGSSGVPRYRIWEGDQWSVERSANYVGGSIRQLILAESPVEEEIILGTGDYNRDFNVQVWDGSGWSGVEQFTSYMDSSTTRGFDIGYESISGDALAVYMDMTLNEGVARYRVWNGALWSPASSTDATNPGAGNVCWVEIVSKPYSDEMMLVTLDDDNDIRAQVWNGSGWGNLITITNSAAAYGYYQCFDVGYEQQSGDAMVIWAESNGDIRSRVWNGVSWENESTIFDLGVPIGYWIKIATDPNSDNAIVGVEDDGMDIHVSMWNSTSWTPLTEIEDDCYEYSKRIFDVAFEGSSGDAMVVWGDSTNTPKYLVWNGSNWGAEGSSSSLASSGYTRWVNLESNVDSDEISLITSDGSSDINVQKWNGDSWNVPYEVEISSSRYYEVSDIVYPWKDTTYSSTELNWKEWRATVTSSLSNNSLVHLSNSIDTITADGLTAIDEGLYEANNELSAITGNSTVVLMSDGLDNAGHHSLIEEALRAKEHNTVIYTVGLGNNEDEVDPILCEIANITGGKYYFAPNSTVLEDIFIGIASEITNFTAAGPTLSMHIPHNYITGLYIATATYIPNSTNSTVGNSTQYSIPMGASQGNAEPILSTEGDRSELLWNLPSMSPGDKWGVWFQVKVQGAGSVPLILPTSSINYTDVNGTNIDVKISYEGETGISGFGASVDYVSLGNISIIPESPTVLIGEDALLDLKAVYSDGNPAIANMQIYSSIGTFNETENPINITISGSDQINLMSMMAGTAHIKAIGSNGNNSVSSNAVVYIRPKGVITLS
ncbi:DUF7594 domain-containing protein [Methanococcoides burtonii]|uniref:VWFA domain-containing protein n=1 Tax=Methanococcoides burtonii (strain DSM 6242 / NBRC 107633 / OCM 468 / ACE-M) TaxID=259564 RepID=Q12VX8_METBU|nr:VWA domain-containing protein [Methanococcoides burtonii]ABE52398.1 hypothetical protein with von Willebrand factor type A domain [Methanococcoides burtonii DSM 6242]